MLKEVIIVEGKNDVIAVKKAVEADVLTTGGFSLNKRSLDLIKIAYDKRGIIVLTDPDNAGENIRKKLSKKFPLAKHAFLFKEDATSNSDIGVERASADVIRKALEKIKTKELVVTNEFSEKDLYMNDLSGTDNASENRNRLGKELGIGYTNAKQFLIRLNNYGIKRSDFESALAKFREDI